MTSSQTYPEPRNPRYQSLDIWRGVACLMIVVWHSHSLRFADLPSGALESKTSLATHIGWVGVVVNKFTQHLDIGVPIFFVISGYCIAASCDSARRRPRSFVRFYSRRFRRIFPPYWVYLGLLVLMFASFAIIGAPDSVVKVDHVAIQKPWTVDIWQAVGSLLLISTWLDRLIPEEGMISTQAWSLCYEEQFYIIAGLFVWLAPKWFFAWMAIVTGLVLAVVLSSGYLHFDPRGFFFDGCWLLFAAGILVYYHVNYAPLGQPFAIPGMILLSLIVLVAVKARFYYSVSVAFALLMCLLQPWDSAFSRWHPALPLAWCGRMCYSLYLIHYPIAGLVAHQSYELGIRGFWPTYLVTVPVSVILSIACAHAFSVAIERRFTKERVGRSILLPPVSAQSSNQATVTAV